MKKKFIFTAAFILSISASIPAFAGSWLVGQDGANARWCYDNGDGTYAKNEWRWIDGDGNGIAECYCFDANGWLLTNTVTPDFYTVNENGAWCVNGIVQTKSTAASPSTDSAAQQVIGWELTESGDWKYYTSGKYLTSQWRKINGKRYYFDENSIMATGFQEIEGDLYYFTSSGALRTKNFTLDGTRYIVEDDGVISDEYETDGPDSVIEKDSSSRKTSSAKSDGSSSSGSSDSTSAKPADSSSSGSSGSTSAKSDSSSSSGGPSSETSVSKEQYQKPDSDRSTYSKQEPDSSYRQSSADKYVISETE